MCTCQDVLNYYNLDSQLLKNHNETPDIVMICPTKDIKTRPSPADPTRERFGALRLLSQISGMVKKADREKFHVKYLGCFGKILMVCAVQKTSFAKFINITEFQYGLFNSQFKVLTCSPQPGNVRDLLVPRVRPSDVRRRVAVGGAAEHRPTGVGELHPRRWFLEEDRTLSVTRQRPFCKPHFQSRLLNCFITIFMYYCL